MNTIVINLISGPSCGKSLMAASIFAKLKIAGYTCELAQEYAKNLVWTEDFETLNNQHHVSREQYKLFKSMQNKVRFIVTDGSLLHGLYYNRYNKDNLSNIDRTEKAILNWYNEFNNINIFLVRGDYPYETFGRTQSEEEAKEIDIILKHTLRQSNVKFTEWESDIKNIDNMVKWIINESSN